MTKRCLDAPIRRPLRFICVFAVLVLCFASGTIPLNAAGGEEAFAWRKFVEVAGQPEPVPEQWVATPEGRFAHSVRIPNPVPKDSGYRPWMTSRQYFEHLCRAEAGEFIFKTVENVEGFLFMRPPRRPTDDDLKHRYKLEAPEIERSFQLLRAAPEERAEVFVNPPWGLFRFVEEPGVRTKSGTATHLRSSGYRQQATPMAVEVGIDVESRYALTWRGLRRPGDRENAIAGSEWIVLDIRTNEVMAVQRNYGLTGRTRNAPGGIWWLNAVNCTASISTHILPSRIYNFVTEALKPGTGAHK